MQKKQRRTFFQACGEAHKLLISAHGQGMEETVTVARKESNPGEGRAKRIQARGISLLAPRPNVR